MIATYRAAWQKRDLISFLVRHVRRASVSSTVLGQIWFLILPVTELFIYYLLIVVIFRSGGRFGSNPFVSLTLGIMHFRLLQNAASSAMSSIHSRSKMLLQIKIEPVILAVAGFRRALLDSAPAIALALIVWAVAGGPPEGSQPWFYPLVLFAWVAMTWVASFLLACATVFARDLTYFVPIALRLLMYLSPVVYTVEFYPESIRSIALLNPVAAVFSLLEWSLLGAERPPAHVLAVIGVSLVVGALVAHRFYAWARPRLTKHL